MAVSSVAAPIERPATDWTFRAEGVTKVYGKTLRANDAITLSVRPGEVYGLLGPNGAGKTTLVKQVIGLLKPDAGRIMLGPFDLVADPDAVGIHLRDGLHPEELAVATIDEAIHRVHGCRMRPARLAGQGREPPVARAKVSQARRTSSWPPSAVPAPRGRHPGGVDTT